LHERLLIREQSTIHTTHWWVWARKTCLVSLAATKRRAHEAWDALRGMGRGEGRDAVLSIAIVTCIRRKMVAD
jgi:hypothetical protein